ALVGPDVPVARAGVVDADRLARGASEELDDRLPGRLAGQVPQRNVHGRVAARFGPGAAGADVLREGDAEAVDRRGILAEQAHSGGLVKVRGDLVGPEESFPEPHQACVRVEAHETEVRE